MERHIVLPTDRSTRQPTSAALAGNKRGLGARRVSNRTGGPSLHFWSRAARFILCMGTLGSSNLYDFVWDFS